MLSRLLRGQGARNRPVDATFPETSALHQARLQAWAIFIGSAGSDRHRGIAGRSSRATLPDIDLSRAVVIPRRPGPLRRLASSIARLSGMGSRRLSAESTSPDAEPVGEDGPAHYMSDRLNAFRRRVTETDPTSRAA